MTSRVIGSIARGGAVRGHRCIDDHSVRCARVQSMRISPQRRRSRSGRPARPRRRAIFLDDRRADRREARRAARSDRRPCVSSMPPAPPKYTGRVHAVAGRPRHSPRQPRDVGPAQPRERRTDAAPGISAARARVGMAVAAQVVAVEARADRRARRRARSIGTLMLWCWPRSASRLARSNVPRSAPNSAVQRRARLSPSSSANAASIAATVSSSSAPTKVCARVEPRVGEQHADRREIAGLRRDDHASGSTARAPASTACSGPPPP